MSSSLTILMPVYNERSTVERAIDDALTAELPVASRQLVLVDDGSTDGTRELLSGRDWPDTVTLVLHDRNRGKGAALQTGLRHATGDFSAILDADLEYRAADLAPLLEPLLAARAIVAPVAPIPVLEAGRVTQFEVPFGYTVIRLNMQFIKEEFVPALVDRHFRLEAGDEYRIAVVNRTDPAQAIWNRNGTSTVACCGVFALVVIVTVASHRPAGSGTGAMATGATIADAAMTTASAGNFIE
jgi:glycosyltransferase involved in cell wall biosynthesis